MKNRFLSPGQIISNRLYCRAYYKKNKEKMKEKNRLYREAHPEYFKKYMSAYCKKHPKQYNEYSRKSRAKKKLSTHSLDNSTPAGV